MSKAPVDTTSSNAALAETGSEGLQATLQPASSEYAEGGILRWLPGPKILREYQKGWLRQDIVAGLVLTSVLVPVGMAYAQASGLPAINGLYATIVPLIVYAILGPSRILVLGPDSSLAGIIAAVILGILLALFASILPARSAAKLDIIRALQYE